MQQGENAIGGKVDIRHLAVSLAHGRITTQTDEFKVGAILAYTVCGNIARIWFCGGMCPYSPLTRIVRLSPLFGEIRPRAARAFNALSECVPKFCIVRDILFPIVWKLH
jgi:hypothetical protein